VTAVCSSCFWAILCVQSAGAESGAVGHGGAGGEVQGAQGLGHLGATQRRGHSALVAGGTSDGAHGVQGL
jgi:hypothetical protein